MLFSNRREAGRKLAQRLLEANFPNPFVLAVPRGGVAVGVEVARALGAPLDLIISRKIPAPFNEELAIGAMAPDGTVVLDENLIRLAALPHGYLERAQEAVQREIGRRLDHYRGERPWPDLRQNTAIIVDDGIATGLTIRAAALSLKKTAQKVVVAAPVAPPDVLTKIPEADALVLLATPEEFYAVGQFYLQFEQLSDADVRDLLQSVWGEEKRP